RVPGQTQVLHEGTGDLLPVRARHGHGMRSVGAGRAVDLAEHLVRGDAAGLPAQAVGEDRHLLAERGGGRGLAVGAREHRHLGGLAGEGSQVLDQRLEGGQPHLVHGPADHQRVGEVVDVLAGAVDVHDLGEGLEGGALQAALDVVLDRLDVVDGLPLDLGVLGDAVGAEVLRDRAQQRPLLIGECAQAGDDLAVQQVDHPLGLHHQAGAVQRRLGEVVDQRCDLAAVAAVERGQGDRGSDVREGVSHGRHSPRTVRAGATGPDGRSVCAYARWLSGSPTPVTASTIAERIPMITPASSAHQKESNSRVSPTSPDTQLASSSMSVLMTSWNSPSVRQVMGKARKDRIGFTRVLISARISAIAPIVRTWVRSVALFSPRCMPGRISAVTHSARPVTMMCPRNRMDPLSVRRLNSASGISPRVRARTPRPGAAHPAYPGCMSDLPARSEGPAETIRLRPTLESLPAYVAGKPAADDRIRRYKVSSNESHLPPIP